MNCKSFTFNNRQIIGHVLQVYVGCSMMREKLNSFLFEWTNWIFEYFSHTNYFNIGWFFSFNNPASVIAIVFRFCILDYKVILLDFVATFQTGYFAHICVVFLPFSQNKQKIYKQWKKLVLWMNRMGFTWYHLLQYTNHLIVKLFSVWDGLHVKNNAVLSLASKNTILFALSE